MWGSAGRAEHLDTQQLQLTLGADRGHMLNNNPIILNQVNKDIQQIRIELAATPIVQLP